MLAKLKWMVLGGGWKQSLHAAKMRWPGTLVLASGVRIGKHTVLDRYMGDNLHIGTSSTVCQHCKLATCGGDLYIGSNVTIGDNAVITAQGGVTVEDHVIFADRVCLIANEHNYRDVSRPIKDQGGYSKPILIGAGSWLGINVTILQGTQIGKNCVVGAGSVVKGTFPDYCVIAGNPARVIKRYDSESGMWLKNEN